MHTSLRLMLVLVGFAVASQSLASPDLVRLRSGVGLYTVPIQLAGTLDTNRNGRPELLVSGRSFVTIVEEDNSPRGYREIARLDAPGISSFASQFAGALLVDVPGQEPALLLSWSEKTELRDAATLAIKATSPSSFSSAAVADVDGDGLPEIVVSFGGTVGLFDPATLAPLGSISLAVVGMAVADILGDARAEIISNEGRAFEVTRTGATLSTTEVWNANISEMATPFVIQFEGHTAIVLQDAFGYGARLATFYPEISLRTLVPATGESLRLLFADANSDGSVDLITTGSHTVRAIDIATGLTLWERDTAYQAPYLGSVNHAVTVDLDGDGTAELVWAVGSYDAGVLAMSIPPLGSPRWRSDFSQSFVFDWTLVERPDGKPSIAYLAPLGTVGFLVGSTLSGSAFADQAGSALTLVPGYPPPARNVQKFAITSSPLPGANGEVVVAVSETQQGASSSTRGLWTYDGNGAVVSERTLQSLTYPQSIIAGQLLDRPERQLTIAGSMWDPASGQPANSSRVEIVDYATGNLLWQSVPLPFTEGASMGELQVADLDADGVPEIIFGYLADIRVFKPQIGSAVVASYTADKFSLFKRGNDQNVKIATLNGYTVNVYDGLSPMPEKTFVLPSSVMGLTFFAQAPDDVLMFATSDYVATTVRRYDNGEIVTSNFNYPYGPIHAIDLEGDNRIELISDYLKIVQLENDYIFRAGFDQPAQ